VHPQDNEPVNIYDGPYGQYVKHGKVNASLPEGETLETMTLEKALPALAAKEGTKKTAKKASSTTAKTTTTTKAATAKKTTTTKRSAKTKTS
jgi:DNA topoisomerase-1